MKKQAERSHRWVEFFEGEDHRLSMTRLMMFMSFPPATLVLWANRYSNHIADILLWYLSAFVLGYIGGKAVDGFSGGRSANKSSRSNSE